MYIIGGLIKTMAGKDIADGYIRTENGRIKEIGKRKGAAIRPENGERVIEVRDGLILPGLIEAHCHMGITEEKKGMEGDDCNETVDPLTPYLRAVDAVNTMDAAFDDAVRAGITCHDRPGKLQCGGRPVCLPENQGTQGGRPGGESARGHEGGIRGESQSKLFRPGKKSFHQNGHCGNAAGGTDRCPGLPGKKKAAEKGEDFEQDFRMECWLPVLDREIPLKAHVHRVDDIFTAVRIAKEFNLKMTLDHCSEGHLIAEELAGEGFPAIVGPDLASRSKIEVQNMAFKTVGILNQAGVMTAITTDHPVSLIQSLPLCAGLAVKSGLPLEEGYKAITIHPAIICGVEARVGSLEVGKDADIAIFSGNPMEVFTETLYTIIDGRVVYEKQEG